MVVLSKNIAVDKGLVPKGGIINNMSFIKNSGVPY